ncbi:DUF3800 domain-containing protein [Actinomadura sp. NPDC023710]|uniref:DUF3800 domain-containing protein n=1 Tax=Actinomadura sp. NPDC023710 TaxID=3158219 RepID=UPI0033EA0E75
MRVAFLGDSEQTNPKRQHVRHLLAFAAVIFPEGSLVGFAEDLAAIRTELGIPASEEIKWKPPKGSFLSSAGGELVSDLRRRMLEAAIARDVRTTTVIIDHGIAYTNWSEEEVGTELLRWLYERVSMHLRDHDDIGIMIADKPGGGPREEKQFLQDTLQLTNDGTEYVEPGRVVLPVLTANSHHVPHLQLADLVAAATTGAIAGHRPALKLGLLLAKLMHRHRMKDVNGAGLVLFPERLNLLYHCFGEKSASKPSANAGVSLPWAEGLYSEDDGLGVPAQPLPVKDDGDG